MKKSFTSTFVMLGLLIGLSAWYILYEGKYRPELKDKEEQTKRLISIDSDQITEFKLASLKKDSKPTRYETIEITKTGPDWFIISPIQTRADNAVVSSLLSAACSAKSERTVEEKPKDLSGYGLKDPSLKLTVTKDATSPAQEIWIGENTPVAYGIYAKTNGSEAVVKTARTLKSSLEKDLFALRDKNIVSVARNDLSEVEIHNAKENIILSRSSSDGRESWNLSRENIPAEITEWNKTLTPLIELKASKVVAEKAEDLASFGLNKPIAKITFTQTNKSRQVVLFGKTKTGLFSKREDLDPIFEVDQTLEDKINTKAVQYRNKHLAQFDRYEVSKIKLERGQETLEISKGDNSVWSFPNEANAKIDSTQIDGLLTKLQDTQLSQYLTQTEKKLVGTPVLKISLFAKKDKQDQPVLNLSFGQPNGKQLKVERTGLPFLFEISKEDFDKLNISKQSLLKVEEKPQETSKPQKKS
jgi:Domain of unknown function (DUF4340)